MKATPHPSDSSEQREAERAIREALGTALGVDLAPLRIPLMSGGSVQIDAVGDGVLCEIFAHTGSLRAGQVRKVMDDAARLRLAARVVGGVNRLMVAFCDEAAARSFRSGWRGEALKLDHIEVVVVILDAALRERVLSAQKRQFR